MFVCVCAVVSDRTEKLLKGIRGQARGLLGRGSAAGQGGQQRAQHAAGQADQGQLGGRTVDSVAARAEESAPKIGDVGEELVQDQKRVTGRESGKAPEAPTDQEAGQHEAHDGTDEERAKRPQGGDEQVKSFEAAAGAQAADEKAEEVFHKQATPGPPPVVHQGGG